jgi:alcohol-forming fatty acyl-CoA reductase
MIDTRLKLVASSLHEPFPGWIDNLTGFTGLTVSILRGTLRTSITDVNCDVEVVPVDIVVNTLIVAAASLKKNS